ncbi:MAG TPA: STAS domain-containing protein [Thermodesulfobacteriota bacterium]|nr:STAS domain-containing protein [Thermodesulfobacteriota bacterium]
MSAARRFALPAGLVRDRLPEVRRALLALLAQGGSLTVDAASVLEVDGPGVQLLLALAKEARARGVELRVTNRSAALEAALAAHRAESLLP